MPRKCTIDESKWDYIVESYLSGISTPTLGKEFNIGSNSISQILKKRGIAIRDYYSCYKKYDKVDNFFEKIDTEEKAYWLGFITADGSLKKNRRTLAITLQASDYDHLYKFKKIISPNSHITYYKTRNIVSLEITSKQIGDNLLNLGITPNKTFTVKPANINTDLLRHYWRGVFDGDGCISICKVKNYLSCKVYVCGNIYIVTGFRDFLSTYGFNPKQKIRPEKSVFRVVYHGNALPKAIMGVLYNNASVFLDRKKVLVDKLVSGKI